MAQTHHHHPHNSHPHAHDHGQDTPVPFSLLRMSALVRAGLALLVLAAMWGLIIWALGAGGGHG